MRGVRPRTKRSILLLAIIGLGVLGVLARAPGRAHPPVRLSADRYENPADGMALFRVTGELPSSLLTPFFPPPVALQIESGRGSVRVIERAKTPRGAELRLQSTTQPGSVTIRAVARGFADASITLHTRRTLADDDGDGFPDVMKLTSLDDQENFRRWFALVAESQYYRESPAWDDQQKDCSGLVRFAFREALKTHSPAWFQRLQLPIYVARPDVRQYTYPHTPIGDKVFRTRPGPFAPADLGDDTFSGFADAQTIKNFNTAFVGRARRLAKKGDLLFYYQPETQRFPYHLMIFLGDVLVDGADRSDWVVYHTGPDHGGPATGSPGLIKKVTLAMLDGHPSPRWRPVPENPNFLGYYRFRILD